MIALYLKDRNIELLPAETAMFYRLAAFVNAISNAPALRLLFDTEKRLEVFKAAFPEIVPYLEKSEGE